MRPAPRGVGLPVPIPPESHTISDKRGSAISTPSKQSNPKILISEATRSQHGNIKSHNVSRMMRSTIT